MNGVDPTLNQSTCLIEYRLIFEMASDVQKISFERVLEFK